MDVLALRQNEPRMAKFTGRLDKYVTAMRDIRLEMQ